MNDNSRKLRRRTIFNFTVFALFWVGIVAGWLFARNATLIGGTPAPFRKVLEWNGSIWKGLFKSSRMNHYPEPFIGKKPRFNGDIGIYVGLRTVDGEYYVSIDMESMLHPQTLLVYEENGKPLALQNGAPLRLLIPVKYGIKSLKRIGAIYFSDTRPPDYWAERGYDWFAGL